ncbi:MAG: hypothetical protein U1F57_07865 [bacterium]
MANSLLRGDYVYEEVYPAFKEGTDEKEKTALLNQVFLQFLLKEGLVFSGNRSIQVADLGCGPCDTIIKYLKGISFSPGFTVRGIDFNEEYAGSGGKAAANLMAAQASGVLKLNQFSVRRGDAFSGHLLDLLCAPGEKAGEHSFRLAFLSHLMYHAHRQEEIDRVLQDISFHVLEEGGLAVLYHVAHRSPGTFQYFRDRYGSNSQNTARTDTPTMNIHDPPSVIAESCGRSGIPCRGLEFATQLYFQRWPEEVWQAYGDPSRYERLAKTDEGAFEDLKRLYFIVQRSPREFAADASPTGLQAYLTEIREVLERNGGALLLEETLQVLTPPEVSEAFQVKMGKALSGTEAQMPVIDREGREEYEKRVSA